MGAGLGSACQLLDRQTDMDRQENGEGWAEIASNCFFSSSKVETSVKCSKDRVICVDCRLPLAL